MTNSARKLLPAIVGLGSDQQQDIAPLEAPVQDAQLWPIEGDQAAIIDV